MSKPINNFKLGVFTLGGLALLVAGILAFGARSYFEPMSEFETYIQGDVTGLAVGSAVELRGVNVGKVKHIDFSWIEYEVTQPSYIVVEFEMRNDIAPVPPGAAENELLQSAVKRGLRARVKAKGITGTSILSIEYVDPTENPPAQVPWIPKYTYIPSAPGEFGELLASVEKTLHKLEGLDFNAMNQLLLADMKSAGNLLDKAGQIDFASLSTNANFLLTDLRSSSTQLKSLIQDTDDTVKKAQLQKLSRDLDSLTGQLQDTVTRLEPGVANIDFEALNQTLTNARQTIQDMDDVLTDLKQYPSGFIFGKPPPPLKGVEPTGKQ
jgi:phospholipid/cholesterol/gamma-HCH transport system substrate-binding protein